MRKKKQKKIAGLNVTYINGVPQYGSLTPALDKIDELKKQFISDPNDIADLMNTRASPLDEYFLEVADKHGIDPFDDGDYDE